MATHRNRVIHTTTGQVEKRNRSFSFHQFHFPRFFMKQEFKWLFFLILIFLTSFSSELYAQKNWYKGNLHTHSLWSDGDDFPEMIMDWYKSNGYHFVSLSDHNILAEGRKWLIVTGNADREKAFDKYLQKYKRPWVEYLENEDTTRVKLKTFNQYRPLFEVKGEFLIVQAEEISAAYEEKPIHINATNIQELIAPKGGNSVAEVMQNNIDAVNAQRKRTGVPMFPHINHPNFGWAITADDMKKLNGEQFFEVYNGHPAVHNEGDDTRSSTEEIWDEVLLHYIGNGQPPLYGIAVDDSHNYHELSSKNSNTGRGWVRVNANDLTAESLISALENGDFYSSSGVELKKLKATSKKIHLVVDTKPGVSYEIQFIGAQEGNKAQVLASIRGNKASYKMKGNEVYVRAKIISSKLKENPYKEGEVEKAWTQPIVRVKK